MNLIEQLGGYSRAKDALELPIDYGFSDSDIKSALSDYRRANNIFEVGDKVLHPMFSGIFTVDTIQSYSVLATSITGYHTSLVISLITHATDAEIKAGRRL